MKKVEHSKKLKITIIVLSVLLLLSISALSVTLVLRESAGSSPAAVNVPENLITPNHDSSNSSAPDSESTVSSAKFKSNTSEQISSDTKTKTATAIDLYNKNPDENIAFKAENMLPGDSETKYFRISVSYHNNISVRFKAHIRPGYEKLAEVMKIKVTMPNYGNTLYDGLMRDMPDNIVHTLLSQGSTTDELYYEITAYLDTTVGNEYQNKSLVADFTWYATEAENLDDSPKTGDKSDIIIWIAVCAVSASLLVVLLFISWKKENGNND